MPARSGHSWNANIWIQPPTIPVGCYELLATILMIQSTKYKILKGFWLLAIEFHPRPGQILLCDFSQGFKKPEMVKSGRPVIVLTSPLKHSTGLVTIVPLSTVEPNPIMPFHYKIPKNCMPQIGRFQISDSWVKGNLIYTVGFHRLDLIKLGKRDPNTGKRIYYSNRLGRERMAEIYKCVLHGLNLGLLSEHL